MRGSLRALLLPTLLVTGCLGEHASPRAVYGMLLTYALAGLAAVVLIIRVVIWWRSRP